MKHHLIDRGRASALGQETLRILEAGFYVSPSGRRVELHSALAHARAATVAHAPDDNLAWPTPGGYIGANWNTGPAKIIDNAIVGYCRETQLDQASRDKAVIARAKELGIYDEIVAEAKKRHQP